MGVWMHWTSRKLQRPHRITIRASCITLEEWRKYWQAKLGGRKGIREGVHPFKKHEERAIIKGLQWALSTK